MSPVQASCPACGGPIPFKIGSAIVVVCPYCRSVVARGDRQLENLGKVADLVPTDSFLGVGLHGRYHDVPFEITGRTQLGHEAGGTWDEWYAAFADGRWGWLAEAQGHFYLTFKHTPHFGSIPSFAELPLGRRLQITPNSAPLTVTEKGEARALSAEGELPFRLEPGATYLYADLSGPKAEFATLDYSETPPLLFTGRQVTLDELGIPVTARPHEREAEQVEGIHVSCPQCGGALELRAPDKTQRVACPNCGALLDANQGELRFLQALDPPGDKPVIPLGTTGRFQVGRIGNPSYDRPFINIGYMKRSIRSEGTKYFWEEYLLYHPRLGFRWLVRSDGHWSWVEPLPPGSVRGGTVSADWEDKRFKIFQKATARVEHVLGEFYWKVSVGEKVWASDYIRPPQMLSREATLKDNGGHKGEIAWSLGTYLPPDAVEKAFGLKNLPRPELGSVAPNQPFPHKNIYWCWLALTAVLVVLGVIVANTSPGRKVFEQTIAFQRDPDPQKPHMVFFSEPFQLKGHGNLQVQADAAVQNSWLDIEGDLINVEKNVIQPFSLPVEYYHGVEGGESWSEGSRRASAYLSALPAGTYRLRLEFESGTPMMPVQVHVRLRQGVAHLLPWFLALLALAVIPVGVIIYHIIFEVHRWQDSEFSPFGTKKQSSDDS
jgi:hypothetical protein